ncbi:LCP family glycopolymer transferase [Bacillus sp. FJAT-44742]|uniref:LCP family glycopolymer transferase n=1 Tax=Bacillus sp. FJAT-44742 TaxID=2014005 RepID=UPI000C237EEA|nr:LCP family protein [Bacillus sp. FJAT-44742]
MGRMEQRRQEARKKRKVKRWIFIPLLVIVLPLTLFGTYLGYKVVTTASDMQEDLARGEKSEKRDEAVDISKDHFSVLFLGVDTDDPNENSRADALILATFNREDSSIKLLSIPRDSLVDIPGRQNRDKINHAHAFGGVDLTIDTVENMLDIPVDFYTKMNFHGFVDIIDALGGVEVDVPFDFETHGTEGSANMVYFEEGRQHLDGEEALGYVRMRKQDPRGDLGRGERQQEVMEAVIRRAGSISSVARYDDVLDEIGNNMSTNLSLGNILSLHPYAQSLDSIETVNLSGSDLTQNGVYYYQVSEDSLQEARDRLKVHLDMIEEPHTYSAQEASDYE